MKKILSAVLALCMILGCVAAGFTAQAAKIGDQLQAAINDAIANGTDLNWTGGNVELTTPLTIKGNVKINFNGATILGAPKKNTIVIKGGNVELINADVEGTSGKGIIDEVSSACPTILISNANVTLTDFVVTGAYFDLFGGDVSIPISDAITLGTANSTLNLNNVRAFGNNGVENLKGSKVNVVDCMIGGYTADFYDSDNVTFADGTTQYSGYDLFTEALADHITLTPGEEELISKVLGLWLVVTASVKNQSYVEPTYSYDADTDTLKVTATADKSYEKQAKCAFDYYYIPKTATINGNTQEFVKTGKLTYTATFENVPGNTVCDTDLVYKLAVGLDGDAQAMIDSLIAQVEGFIKNDLPNVINSITSTLEDAWETYLLGDQGYASIIWNIYNNPAYDSFLASYPENERAAVDADIHEFLGVMFDICGIELRASQLEDNDNFKKAINAVREGTASASQLTQVKNMTFDTNKKFGSNLQVNAVESGLWYDECDTPETMIGAGLYPKLLNIWYVVHFGVIGSEYKEMGEFFGKYYEEIYNDICKGELKPVLEKAAAILADEDNYVMQLLAQAGGAFDLSTVGDVSGYIDLAFNYIDSLFASATYQNMKNKYGRLVPELCGTYLEKAYTIATNLDTYLDIETDGNLMEGFEFPQEATFTTPTDEETVKVTVNIHGFGKYSVDSVVYASTQHFDVPVGGSFTVAPVEMDGSTTPLFKYYSLGDGNGNERLSPTGGTLTVFNDTIVNVNFGWEANVYEIAFMTNYELSSLWLNTTSSNELRDNGLPEVPEFEGATFLGWASENISGVTAQESGALLTEAQILALADNATENLTFYAIFSIPNETVSNEILNSTLLSMTENYDSDGKAYFTVLFSDRTLADGDVIVEAGVIAAASAAAINNATATTGSSIIRGTVNFNKYSLPMLYTYKVSVGSATNMTVYAKGYVIIQHTDGTYSYDYTNVYTVAL